MSILYSIPTLLSIFFYVGAVIVLATRPSDGSKAKLYSILGTAILLFSSLSGWALRFVISMTFDSSSLGMVYAMFSILQTLLYFVGLGLILMAVITGRKPAVANTSADPAGGDRPPQASDNPYVSPGSR